LGVAEFFFTEDQVQWLAAQIKVLAQLQIGHDAQVDASTILRFNDLYGISLQKAGMMGNVVMGRIVAQDDAEIIKFVIMIRQIQFYTALREGVRQCNTKPDQTNYFSPM